MNRYIGVFDSGLGGLTTVKAITERHPDRNIVFFGDTENMPYGEKNREQIIDLALKDIQILRNFDLSAIIIACNTCDCNASEEIKRHCDVPVFGVIGPAARNAVSKTLNRKIGVLATESTVSSEEYVRKIKELDDRAEVYQMACPKLVPLIEEGRFLQEDELMDKALEEYLNPLLELNIDTLILGCTHYDLLTDLISRKAPSLKIVSSSRCVVDDLSVLLDKDGKAEDSREAEKIFLVSKDPEHFQKIASNLITNIEIKKSN